MCINVSYSRKVIKLSIFVFFIIIAAAVLFLFVYKKNSEAQAKVCINSACFNVEIAKTAQEREKGLMFRESLAEKEGMFFIFNKENTHSFWMKNTLVPLDIIWIDGNRKVVYIKKNVQPCTSSVCENIIPQSLAKYVLEINAGVSDKEGISVGDDIKLINI